MRNDNKTLTELFSQEYASFDPMTSLKIMLKLCESKAEFKDFFHKLAALETVMMCSGVPKDGLNQVRATMHHLVILRYQIV